MKCKGMRPRIEFLAPELKQKKDPTVRDVVVAYEQDQEQYKNHIEGHVHKALKKKKEEQQKKRQAILNFLLYAHIMFVIEILVFWRLTH